MSTFIAISRRIPLRHSVDVMVVGGGPAGMAAALSAARQGRSVFLAEAQSCFGGMGTAGLLPLFMPFGDRTHFYADGFGRELRDRLYAAGGCGPHCGPDNLAPTIRAEVLKRVYDQLAVEAGLSFSFLTQAVDLETDGERVTHVICGAKSGLFAVEAKVFVDCSGDGDVAAWAGAPFEKGDAQGRMMPGTLCSQWTNIDFEAVRASGLVAEHELERAFADRVFSLEDRHLPGMWRTAEGEQGANMGHAFGVDGTDERSLTAAFVRSRQQVLEYERYYKEYLKGYEQMRLLATASQFGIRETRRIVGDYVLGRDDYNNRAIFDDEIGRFNYWIDIHPTTPDPADWAQHVNLRNNPLRDGESYGIPYRTLTPRGLSNVLVAGRCVSTDQWVQSSLRVMPGCYITGQAAGVAAALAVEQATDTRGIAVDELQARLKRMGAFLPNASG